MAAFDENPILELGTKPISDGAPGGADISDDEENLALEAELAKLDRIDLGTPDWYRIESYATNILRGKCKDVQAACALGYALWTRARYAGLAAALGVLDSLVKTFWEHLSPARPRRRKVLVEGLTERLVDGGWFSGEGQPRPDDFDALDRCIERLAALKQSFAEKLPDDLPDFNKCNRKLKDLAGLRPKPAAPPPQAAAPAPGADAGGAAPAAPAATGGGAFAAPAVENVSGAIGAIMSAATFLRKADPRDPRPYAVARQVKWSRLELPASEEAKHQIEPPEKTQVEALAHQFGKNLWENLLNNAEGAFRGNDPLWLDLQRYVCAAMQGLGAEYEKARIAVMQATAGLVARLGKGVYELTFRGGMPLCSGETRMWIDGEVLTAFGGGGGGGGGAGAGNGRLTEATDAARKLAGAGKLTEALRTLQEGLLSSGERRERFMWRLRIAQLCVDSQRLQLAAPLLEECFEDSRRHGIQEWEPSLAAEVADALYRCRKALLAAEKQPTPELTARLKESFAWLCQLDPLAALAVEPAGK